MPETPYYDLSNEQLGTLRETLADRYWDAVDMLASIVADRALVNTEILTRDDYYE